MYAVVALRYGFTAQDINAMTLARMKWWFESAERIAKLTKGDDDGQ